LTVTRDHFYGSKEKPSDLFEVSFEVTFVFMDTFPTKRTAPASKKASANTTPSKTVKSALALTVIGLTNPDFSNPHICGTRTIQPQTKIYCKGEHHE